MKKAFCEKYCSFSCYIGKLASKLVLALNSYSIKTDISQKYTYDNFFFEKENPEILCFIIKMKRTTGCDE